MNRWQFLLLLLGSLCRVVPGTAQTAPSQWVSYDPASKTVTFALEAGAPGKAGPFNFNDLRTPLIGSTVEVETSSPLVVIAVVLDRCAPLTPTRAPLRSAPAMWWHAQSIVMRDLSRHTLDEWDGPPLVVIRPDVRQAPSLCGGDARQMIRAGYEAARSTPVLAGLRAG
jgi:hypothetical protein